MIVLGHRGYSARYPENTLIAFRKALELGADGVELDLRGTKDGKVVVIHDEDLKRLCGVDVKVSEVSFGELRNYRVQSESIPSFEEVLSILGSDHILNAEIKEARVAERTLQLIDEFGLTRNTVVSSFDHQLVVSLIKKRPDMKFGFLVGEELRNDPISLIERLLQYKPYSMHLPHQLFDYPIVAEKIVKLVRNAGAKIYVWTLDDPNKYERIKQHLDCVITNQVELFVRLKKSA
ncbi:glycerophosphodiester phosphodiesterase [Thermotoga sp. Ku-13t]|uniref:glycerophosphodiester phosphodiesterase family protein n=1 Tax=Thermotoga sp. Ku-13t TaxID=1755813 RepID=UPI0013EDC78A|nr:glycerophosphodiester phosphodiesterase family protein [Thermotoga sp. Ku-13t]KAF2957189.1 glycerophosphodiester phosphodiesterase [Thermotoga sp. Ku-13t]